MPITNQIQQMTSANNAAAMAAADKANKFSAEQAAITRAYNAEEAAKAREWSKMMSDTSYQRQVADLKAAGINPVLGYMKGSGASTPNAATASASGVSGIRAETDFSGVSATAQSYSADIQERIAEQRIDVDKLMQKLDHAQEWKITEAQLKNDINKANISASATVEAAEKSANATVESASLHSAATTMAATITAAASRYGADQTAESHIVAATIAAAASRYGADKNFDAAVLKAETEKLLEQWSNIHDKNMQARDFDYKKKLAEIDFNYLMEQLERYPNNIWQSDELFAQQLEYIAAHSEGGVAGIFSTWLTETALKLDKSTSNGLTK